MGAAGAAVWGVARAGAVSPEADIAFHRWISDGCAATMDWLASYPELRRDPRLLVEGARSVIIAAFPYRRDLSDPSMRPILPISRYALGADYHDVVRRRLTPVAEACGAGSRVCVDSAPVRERYWAVRAGLGHIGRNNLLIIPGLGSMNFLGCIITPALIESDTPLPSASSPCHDCDAPCLKACPTGAIRPDSTIDARRCLAYLTIEHRGPFPHGTDLHGRLFGCDACALACPLNRLPLPPGQPLADFDPLPHTLALTPGDINTMSQRAFARRFAGSPLMRARIASLRRNLDLLDHKPQ